jgi:hypothetical protein
VPLPAVNPYNKDEIEYQEPGFDYAPKYPGSYDYNESGIAYAESGFPYQKRDATVSASTIACSADLSPVFAYVYTPKRPGGIGYSSGYDYNKTGFDYNERDTSIPDNRLLVDYSQSGISYSQPVDTGHTVTVIATPATIGVTTTFSASPSVPATVTPSTVACPVVIVPSVTANSISVHGGITAPATLPTPTISATVTAATVATAATFPGHSLYITVDATPGVIAATTTMPSETPSGNFTATPAVIGIQVAIPTVPMFERLVMPSEDTLPRAINPQDSSPAAYALMRHFAPGAKGTNIFIVDETTVQSYLPADWSTVSRWIYGGHASPTDLTSSEVSLLASAGYSFNAGPE